MTTKYKREILNQLVTGRTDKAGLLDMLNAGPWLWFLGDGKYYCKSTGFTHLSLTETQYKQFISNGGHHLVFRKASYNDNTTEAGNTGNIA